MVSLLRLKAPRRFPAWRADVSPRRASRRCGTWEYYRITLENVVIVEVLLRDHGAATDIEYEFEAEKVKFQYWEQGGMGGKGAETRMGWDIKNSTSYF